MSKLKSDPLLAAAKVILALGVALFIFVMAMVLIGIGAVLTVQRDEILAKLAQAGAPDGAYWVVVLALVLIEALMFIGLRFVLELSGIVKSVDRGDPFEPENANRLSRMGWLMVGGYVLGLVLGAIAAWIKEVAGDAGPLDMDANFDLGGGGILLILTLFILARVFRQGTAMREELEGTV
jgi:hypothetical protein